jgi:hypothetical protein
MNIYVWLCTIYFQWCTEQSIPLLVWGKSYQDPTILAVVCLSSNCWYSVQNTNLWWKTLMLWSCGWSATSSWWVAACSWLALLLLVQLLGLSFSSWTCCWLLVLLLLGWSWASGYSMVLLGVVLMDLWCCGRTLVFFELVLCCSVVSFLLWPSSSSPAAGSAELLWCCQ